MAQGDEQWRTRRGACSRVLARSVLGASRVMAKPIDMGDIPALVHDVARPAQIN
jgi:hypothetical protein